MTLKQQVASVQSAVADVSEQVVPGSGVVTPKPARSYPTSTMAYDSGTAFDVPTETINKTFRPMWRVPDVAVQQNKVITTNLPPAVTATGVVVSPTMTSNTLASVPDMSAPVRHKAGTQIQISWSMSAALSTATAQATFAHYRDNVQIGPLVYGSSPADAQKFSVSQSFIDTPGGRGHPVHKYAVYWSTNAGTLTADAKNRVMHILTLKPQ